MRALAASPLGFVIGLALGTLGGGGSILAVPALVYVAGQDARAATTTSLLMVGASAAMGMVRHLRAGRVRLGAGTLFGICGLGGSVLGSALNRRLDPEVLLLGFAGVMVVAAWRMLAGCPSCTRVGEEAATAKASASATGSVRTLAPPVARRRVVAYVAAGSAIGFFTGLFGVGGGFVIVPALTLLLGFAMPEAVGTSLLVIAINAASALVFRLEAGIEWAVTLPFAAAAVAGAASGSRLADRLPATTMLRAFAALLVALAAYTGLRSGLAL